jgi:hypothetical protein
MLKRFTAITALVTAAVFSPTIIAATLGVTPTTTSTPVSVEVVEYYNGGLDHYFMTADPSEMAILDNGILPGWSRTGAQFDAFSADSAGADLSPVCRFYGRPEAGLNSHFYSGSAEECTAMLTQFSNAWIFESSDIFRIAMPDVSTGACPQSTLPVYRLYNNRPDVNHRYTADAGVRSGLVARGYIAEGYGPDGVAFCATGAQAPSQDNPSQLSIIVTPITSDMFSFGSVLSAATAITVASYSWNFGDGSFDTSATPSHQYAAAGDYTVLLTATDTLGRQSSAAKTVSAKSATPPSTPSPGGGSDFEQRKNAAGVVRWFDFDTVSQLGSTVYGANVGYGVGQKSGPVIDTDVKASGGGSMRFDVYGKTGSDAAGSWFANYSADLSVRFGPSSVHYVQWRQRFNQAMIDTYLFAAERDASGNFIPGTHNQEGIKQMGISPGDTPTKLYNYCEANDLVVQTYYQQRFPIAYNSCTGSASHGPYAGLYQSVDVSSGFQLFQNARSACSYNAVVADGITTKPSAGCFGWVPNEWLTFEIRIKLGARNDTTREFDGSELQLWGARDGGDPVLLIDWRPGIGGYFPFTSGTSSDLSGQQLGKLVLLPYMTAKDPTQDHPLMQTWYDEVIISRNPINFPGGKSVAIPRTDNKPQAPTPASNASGAPGTYPAWRMNMPVGMFSPIPGTANLAGVVNYIEGRTGLVPQHPSYVVDAWNGIATRKETNDLWFVASSGHGQWWNGIVGANLSADNVQISLVDPGSNPSVVNTTDGIFTDQRPTGRHTYTESQYLTNGNKLLLLGTNAAYAINAGYGGGPDISAFDVSSRSWDPPGTFGQVPSEALGKYGYLFNSAVRDYRDGAIYLAGGYSLWKTTDGANWSLLIRDRSDPRFLSWDQGPSGGNSYPCIDTKRNAIVDLHSGYPYSLSGGVRLQVVSLANGRLTEIPVTGLPPPTRDASGGSSYLHLAEASLAYDEDNDRYLYPYGATVYSIDPTSGVAASIATIPAPDPSIGFQTVENRFDYVPRLGGVLYIPRFGGNWMFMPTR